MFSLTFQCEHISDAIGNKIGCSAFHVQGINEKKESFSHDIVICAHIQLTYSGDKQKPHGGLKLTLMCN